MNENIKIDNKECVLKSSIKNSEPVSLANKKYVIARTQSSGVFAGFLKKREGREITLMNARRFYYWDGADSLSQLSVEGVSEPDNCKFGEPFDEVLLTDLVQLLPCTKKVQESIESVNSIHDTNSISSVNNTSLNYYHVLKKIKKVLKMLI